MPALGSTCGRRGPYPTVLGRPAPDAWAHHCLGPGVMVVTARSAREHVAAVRASMANGFALVE
jgi:hypothetical protein